MRTMRLRDSRLISEFEAPYIVAELNTSHSGSIDVAKEMVIQAKKAGCDCVKFQSWSPGSINSKTFYDENPIASRIYQKFSLAEEQLLEVAKFCKDLDISFSSTPYSRAEVDFLVNVCQAPFVKVASMDLNNYMFLDYIAQTGVPVVLSTGMGELEEIHKAIKTIENAGNKNICILHCISIYPPEMSTIRLKNIWGLQNEFPDYPIGFSDHSIGIEIATAAVALGACLIEKHFTLDKKKIGMDNQVASEPDEMAQLVRNCHNVHLALGDTNRVVLPAEIEQKNKIRRSIIAARDLKAGTVLTVEDFDFKRPGTGFPPEKINELVGRKLLRDVQADRLMTKADVS